MTALAILIVTLEPHPQALGPEVVFVSDPWPVRLRSEYDTETVLAERPTGDPAPEAFEQLRGNLALKTDEELVRLLVRAVRESAELASIGDLEVDVLAFEIQRVLIGRLQAKDREIDALHTRLAGMDELYVERGRQLSEARDEIARLSR